MIKSFFAITLRLLWRNKVTSFVNLLSLTIGITAFLFIMLFVENELGYDRFNENYEHIYRLEADDFAKLPPVIGPHVKERIPEIENIARLAGNEDTDVMYKPDRHPEKITHARVNLLWADSTTFDVFTFPFIKGQANAALSKPFTCVLTETVAKTLFGNADPVGKTVEVFDHEFEITGIIHDVKKSHLDVKVLVSLSSQPRVFADRDLGNTGRNSWLWSATYVRASGNFDHASVGKKINDALAEINNGLHS